MKRLFATAMLLSLVVPMLVGFGLSGSVNDPISEGTSAPADTTITWINTNDDGVYHFNSSLQLWLDGGQWIRYNHLVGSSDLFLRMGQGSEGDTTQATALGHSFTDSLWISKWIWNSSLPSGATLDTIKIYEANFSTAPIMIKAAAWGAGPGGSGDIDLFAGPCVLPVLHVNGTGVDLIKMQVGIQVFNFVRPQ